MRETAVYCTRIPHKYEWIGAKMRAQERKKTGGTRLIDAERLCECLEKQLAEDMETSRHGKSLRKEVVNALKHWDYEKDDLLEMLLIWTKVLKPEAEVGN